jgi:hypothetical protein
VAHGIERFVAASILPGGPRGSGADAERGGQARQPQHSTPVQTFHSTPSSTNFDPSKISVYKNKVNWDAESMRIAGGLGMCARHVTAWVGLRGCRSLLALSAALGMPAEAVAGQSQAAAGQSPPFEIADNSFLVEEAFNQEAGVFQNIFNGVRTGQTWAAIFTQEWPVVSQTHQLSYSLSWANNPGSNFGDVLINYRYQALMEAPGVPAFSPRVSLVLPGGEAGRDSPGVQINLPFSKQTSDIYWHWNAGITVLPSAEAGTEKVSLESPFFAGSAIARIRPMLHGMLESVLLFADEPTESGTARRTIFTLSPGVRGGWNIGDHQAIVGLAVPITWSDDETETAALVYFSYELPFKK